MPTLSESCYAPIGFLCAYPVAEKGCSSSKGGRIFRRFDINLPLRLTRSEAICEPRRGSLQLSKVTTSSPLAAGSSNAAVLGHSGL